MWRLNQLVNEMADEVERLTLALRARHGHATPHPHAEDVRRLQAALEEARAAEPHDPALPALAATINKLVLADSYIATLAVALDDATAAQRAGGQPGPGPVPPGGAARRRPVASASSAGARRRCVMPSGSPWR